MYYILTDRNLCKSNQVIASVVNPSLSTDIVTQPSSRCVQPNRHSSGHVDLVRKARHSNESRKISRIENACSYGLSNATSKQVEMMQRFTEQGDCASVAYLKSKFKAQRKQRERKNQRKKQLVSSELVSQGWLRLVEPENVETVETRKKSIKEKLSQIRDYIFTESEERDINARAEEYVMSVQPHVRHFIVPESTRSVSQDPLYRASLNGWQLQYPLPKKKRQRNYLTDTCYLTPAKAGQASYLPIGTRFLRPSQKLTELIADVLNDSPDGLLQAPHIYTALENKYPYFKLIDSAARGSWRSSVRNALHQKYFLKIKFNVRVFSSKGSYWLLNPEYGPNDWRDEIHVERILSWKAQKHPKANSNVPASGTAPQNDDTEVNSAVLNLLSVERDAQNSENSSRADLLEIARECGISIESPCSLPGKSANGEGHLRAPNFNKRSCTRTSPSLLGNSLRTDPILTTCASSLTEEDTCNSRFEESCFTSHSDLERLTHAAPDTGSMMYDGLGCMDDVHSLQGTRSSCISPFVFTLPRTFDALGGDDQLEHSPLTSLENFHILGEDSRGVSTSKIGSSNSSAVSSNSLFDANLLAENDLMEKDYGNLDLNTIRYDFLMHEET